MIVRILVFLTFLIPSFLQQHAVSYSCSGLFDLKVLLDRYPGSWPVFMDYSPYKGKERIDFPNGSFCEVFGFQEFEWPTELNFIPAGLAILWLLGFLFSKERSGRKGWAIILTMVTTGYYSFLLQVHFFPTFVGFGILVFTMVSMVAWFLGVGGGFWRQKKVFSKATFFIAVVIGLGLAIAHGLTGNPKDWKEVLSFGLFYPVVPILGSFLIVASYELIPWKQAMGSGSGENARD